MKIVFISAPFRGANSWEIEQNIRAAEWWALAIWDLGVAVICPHTNTRFFHGTLDDEVWLQGYLSILEKCDAIFTFGSSERTKAEIKAASELGIPVFTHYSLLKKWLTKEAQLDEYKVKYLCQSCRASGTIAITKKQLETRNIICPKCKSEVSWVLNNSKRLEE